MYIYTYMEDCIPLRNVKLRSTCTDMCAERERESEKTEKEREREKERREIEGRESEREFVRERR